MQTQQYTTQAPAPVLTPMAPPVAANRYPTIEQAAQLRPAFTPAALRDIRFKSADRLNSRGEVIKGNGSSSAWITIGRKVLLDLEAFDTWIESHRGGNERDEDVKRKAHHGSLVDRNCNHPRPNLPSRTKGKRSAP